MSVQVAMELAHHFRSLPKSSKNISRLREATVNVTVHRQYDLSYHGGTPPWAYKESKHNFY